MLRQPSESCIFESTLVYRIIVQDGINVQAGKIPKINKRAGWNKAVQVGIFHFLLLKIKVLAWNFPKLINVQDGIRPCRLEFFKKLIKCAARLLDRLGYSNSFSVSVTRFLHNALENCLFYIFKASFQSQKSIAFFWK